MLYLKGMANWHMNGCIPFLSHSALGFNRPNAETSGAIIQLMILGCSFDDNDDDDDDDDRSVQHKSCQGQLHNFSAMN